MIICKHQLSEEDPPRTRQAYPHTNYLDKFLAGLPESS